MREAVAAYRRALVPNAAMGERRAIGYELRDAGDWDGAAEAFQRALEALEATGPHDADGALDSNKAREYRDPAPIMSPSRRRSKSTARSSRTTTCSTCFRLMPSQRPPPRMRRSSVRRSTRCSARARSGPSTSRRRSRRDPARTNFTLRSFSKERTSAGASCAGAAAGPCGVEPGTAWAPRAATTSTTTCRSH